MPRITRLLETALYVDDLAHSAGFYDEVLGLRRLFGDARLIAFDVPGGSVLLLFRRGTTLTTAHCRAAPSRRTMGEGRCTWLLRSRPGSCPRGRPGCPSMALRSRVARFGRAAEPASTFVTATGTCSNLPRPASGRPIEKAPSTDGRCDYLTPNATRWPGP